MPRFYIDFQDGDQMHVDSEGSDLATFEEAREEATGLLPQVAKDELPDGEHRVFAATVRDGSGTSLYRATLTFHGQMLTSKPH